MIPTGTTLATASAVPSQVSCVTMSPDSLATRMRYPGGGDAGDAARPVRTASAAMRRIGKKIPLPALWCAGALRLQTLGRVEPPRLLDHLPQHAGTDAPQPHQHRRVTAVVVGDEKGPRVRLHPEVALVVAAFDDERRAVLL